MYLTACSTCSPWIFRVDIIQKMSHMSYRDAHYCLLPLSDVYQLKMTCSIEKYWWHFQEIKVAHYAGLSHISLQMEQKKGIKVWLIFIIAALNGTTYLWYCNSMINLCCHKVCNIKRGTLSSISTQ